MYRHINVAVILLWFVFNLGLVALSGQAFSATLHTNFDQHFNIRDEIKEVSVPIGIYDIGYVVYSKKFAERFGYPPEYIAELSPGMQALEFRMESKGGFVRCTLNTLLDDNLGLDLPRQEYKNRFERLNGMMRFPKKLDSYKDADGWYKELPEDKAFRLQVRQEKWHYYSRNIYLADYHYSPGEGRTWFASTMLEDYTNRYLRGLDYLSVNLGCVSLTYERLLLKAPSLWVKKKDGEDYTQKTGGPKPGQFIKFRIPEPFAQKSAELLKPVIETDYNFFKAIKKD